MPTRTVLGVKAVRMKGSKQESYTSWGQLILNSDEEDETAELMRELDKIKKERAEQREKEVHSSISEATSVGLLADTWH